MWPRERKRRGPRALGRCTARHTGLLEARGWVGSQPPSGNKHATHDMGGPALTPETSVLQPSLAIGLGTVPGPLGLRTRPET